MIHHYLFCLLFVTGIFAQAVAQDDEYIVSSRTLNLREGPGTEYPVIAALPEGASVKVLSRMANGWWQVRHDYRLGYVASRYLESAAVLYEGWERTNISSGDEPDCWNYSPSYDPEINNYLKVSVGKNTDVVIKLMEKRTERCIRYVYIRSNEVYYLRNVPQGSYYLKLAYGRDWRQKVENRQCVGKFMRNAQYEKGLEIMDFRIKHTYGGYNVPSYELFLDVVEYNVRNTFSSRDISEHEFNR